MGPPRLETNFRETTALRPHIEVLDGVRGLAILLVLWVHFGQLFTAEEGTRLWKIFIVGQTGVDLFFVLSGFLITGILLDAKGSPHFLRNFYLRRMLRIVPLYYAALLCLYLIAPALGLSEWVSWKQSFWFWAYLQDIPQAFKPSLQTGPNHFWSLAVEQHFYLFWPFAVLRFERGKLLWIIAGAIAVSLITRIVWSHYEMYYFTLARLDSLSLGGALAIFARRRESPGLAWVVPWAKRVLYFGGAAVLVGVFLPHFFSPLTYLLRNTLVALFYAAGLVLVLENQCGIFGRALASGALTSVGRYSYAMYIFHPFIFAFLLSKGLMTYRPWSLILGGGITYLAGWMSWHVLEKPVLGLKRYFQYTSTKKTESATLPTC